MNIPAMTLFFIGFYLYNYWEKLLQKDYLHLFDFLESIQTAFLLFYEFISYTLQGIGFDTPTMFMNLYMLSLMFAAFIHFWGKHVRGEEG